MDNSASSLRERLRTETKADHEKLDAIVHEIAPFNSSNGYRTYLNCLSVLYIQYGYGIDWTSEASGIPKTVDELLNAIAQDTREPLSRPETPSDLIQETAGIRASYWAAGYVMEGSAMGARMITGVTSKVANGSATTARSFAPEGMGHSYLLKLATDSFERWPAFVAALGKANCDHDAVIEEAKAIFSFAERTFLNALSQQPSTVRASN